MKQEPSYLVRASDPSATSVVRIAGQMFEKRGERETAREVYAVADMMQRWLEENPVEGKGR